MHFSGMSSELKLSHLAGISEAQMGETLEEKIQKKEAEIFSLRTELAGLRAQKQLTPLSRDYHFRDGLGRSVSFESLFGYHRDLFVMQSIGESSPYCTLWADGFNGIYPHLRTRCAFVLISDDPSQVTQDFAQSRGWQFPIYSSANTSFKEDFGFIEGGVQKSGASTFYRDGMGTISLVGSTFFGPGDPFCPIWHMLDLLHEGEEGWRPKNSYSRESA